MRKVILYLTVLWLTTSGFDKKPPHTIYNNYETRIIVSDEKKFTYEVKYSVIVFNHKGRSNLVVDIPLNDNKKLESVSIIYKKNGKVEKKLNSKDLEKRVVNSDIASSFFYNTGRYESISYPMEMEVSYRIKYNGFIRLPEFFVIGSEEEICRQARIIVETPQDMPLKYLARHADFTYKTANAGGKTTHLFEASNLSIDSYEPGQEYNIPGLLLNIPRFVYYGRQGSNENYESLSRFFWELWKDETGLPAEHLNYIKEITATANTDKEKIRIVYEYLQNNFRYISVQLGVGGYKPLPVASTYKNKYGDCKGLTNYMFHALKAIGIESYPVIIYGGVPLPYLMTENFVYDYANHIVLMSPNKGDTLWLECTSKTSDFNFLSSFTENRTGLPIMQTGGKLIHTPASSAANSKLGINTIVNIKDDASADVIHNIHATGEASAGLRRYIHGTKSQVMDFLTNLVLWKQPRSLTIIKKEKNHLGELRMYIDNPYNTKTNDKIFLKLYPYNYSVKNYQSDKERKKDFILPFPFIESDTIVYQFPAGYKLISSPPNVKIDSKYFLFNSKREYDAENNTLTIVTEYIQKERIIPAGDFNEFKRLNSALLTDRSSNITLQKQ